MIITLYEGIYQKRCRKDTAKHKEWMIRNYCLAFSAVTLRILLIAFSFAGTNISYTLGCYSWIPNLIFAEYYIRY
jgi:uncharacterized membrane protein